MGDMDVGGGFLRLSLAPILRNHRIWAVILRVLSVYNVCRHTRAVFVFLNPTFLLHRHVALHARGRTVLLPESPNPFVRRHYRLSKR